MLNRVTKRILENGFWLSLLLHLLLLLAFLTFISLQPVQEQQPLPHHYVPAYTYSGSIKPSAQRQQAKNSKQSKSDNNTTNKTNSLETAENIQSVKDTRSQITVPKILKKIPTLKNHTVTGSLLASSFNMLKEEQMREVSQKRESEPIYMIGDDSMPADPLIKLIGRSLSAHFGYPRMAGELGIRGRVVLSLTLHPEGHYSNVEMVRSSDNQDLDAAALYAVNSAPKVYGADRFISKPKHFVIGFVFN